MKKKMTIEQKQKFYTQLHEENDERIQKLLEERFDYSKIKLERIKKR